MQDIRLESSFLYTRALSGLSVPLERKPAEKVETSILHLLGGKDSQTHLKSKKVAIRRKLPSFFLHRQRSDKKMLMPLTQIQDGKGFIGVTTPLPNARSLFFLTSLAAISEDGTCFSLSTAVIASTSFQ